MTWIYLILLFRFVQFLQKGRGGELGDIEPLLGAWGKSGDEIKHLPP
jgi:hypothetical protein